MNRSRLSRLGGVAGLAFLAACATETPVQTTGSDATVINRTGRPIASISYQPCGASPDAWTPLGVPAIAPQATVPFRLPASCSNLRAYFPDGKLAGMHSGVKWDFPFTWVLS